MMEDLRRRGAWVIDTGPEEAGVESVNAYAPNPSAARTALTRVRNSVMWITLIGVTPGTNGSSVNAADWTPTLGV